MLTFFVEVIDLVRGCIDINHENTKSAECDISTQIELAKTRAVDCVLHIELEDGDGKLISSQVQIAKV